MSFDDNSQNAPSDVFERLHESGRPSKRAFSQSLEEQIDHDQKEGKAEIWFWIVWSASVIRIISQNFEFNVAWLERIAGIFRHHHFPKLVSLLEVIYGYHLYECDYVLPDWLLKAWGSLSVELSKFMVFDMCCWYLETDFVLTGLSSWIYLHTTSLILASIISKAMWRVITLKWTRRLIRFILPPWRRAQRV